MDGHWWVNPDELDDYQRDAIALPLDEDHFVTGPPGSGKTNLLVLRSTNLIRNNISNIMMLVFNRTLEEFIANCPTPYSLPRDKLRTMQRWEMELIHQLGGKPSSSADFDSARVENCAILTNIVTSQNLHRLYDVILLDESQDYLLDEIALVLRLAKNVFAAGDNRQRIYDHTSPIAHLEAKCKTHHLPYHYRNGHRICELADAIGSNWTDYTALLGTSQYNERTRPSKVTVTRCNTIDEQATSIVSSVRLQLKAYPNEMIGVLCPRKKELTTIRNAFLDTDIEPTVIFQSSQEGYLPFNQQSRVCISTLHGAKGLEFRATHIAGAEWIKRFREVQRRMAFTGVTRAKTVLSIYHSEKLPPYLEGGLASISPRPTPPALDDLFKAK